MKTEQKIKNDEINQFSFKDIEQVNLKIIINL
jgi:hypothetical protein